MAATRTATRKKRKRPTARERMEKMAPSAQSLRKLVKKFRPPQSWYDETDNPFEADSK